jgi:DNA-binding transcriptional regulator YiaG
MAAFARKLGVTVQEVSNWETGRCKPRRKNVIKILKYQERKMMSVRYAGE